jgi:hypothetical protein
MENRQKFPKPRKFIMSVSVLGFRYIVFKPVYAFIVMAIDWEKQISMSL